jgi:hypothetical protein
MIRLRHDLAFRKAKRLFSFLRTCRERSGRTKGSGKKVSARVHEAM